MDDSRTSITVVMIFRVWKISVIICLKAFCWNIQRFKQFYFIFLNFVYKVLTMQKRLQLSQCLFYFLGPSSLLSTGCDCTQGKTARTRLSGFRRELFDVRWRQNLGLLLSHAGEQRKNKLSPSKMTYFILWWNSERCIRLWDQAGSVETNYSWFWIPDDPKAPWLQISFQESTPRNLSALNSVVFLTLAQKCISWKMIEH